MRTIPIVVVCGVLMALGAGNAQAATNYPDQPTRAQVKALERREACDDQLDALETKICKARRWSEGHVIKSHHSKGRKSRNFDEDIDFTPSTLPDSFFTPVIKNEPDHKPNYGQNAYCMVVCR